MFSLMLTHFDRKRRGVLLVAGVAQVGLVADRVAALYMTYISTVTDTSAPWSPRRRAWVTVDGRVLRRERSTLVYFERLASFGTRRGEFMVRI